jgi:GNAT superfamily N-acetyltransferase
MKGRLREGFRDKDGALFFGESDGWRITGWIHVSATPLLEVERRAEVNRLIVDETGRSRGAGALLLKAGEKWARAKKCKGCPPGASTRILFAQRVRALQDAKGVPEAALSKVIAEH